MAKLFLRSCSKARIPFAVAATLAFAACAPRGKGADEATLSRLAASESKVEKLEERLATLEEKAGRLDGVAEGVTLLLEKLDQLGGTAPPKKKQPSSTAIYSIPIDGDPFIGPEFAKVTIVKGYDFYCSFCDRVRPTLADLQTLYGKDIKIVFKNLVIHEEYARLPALAACAAHKQGKFMPMFEQIWVKGMRAQTELTEESLLAIAKSLKLNQKRFIADMSGECEDKVQNDFEIMSSFTTATPAFFINGRFMAGAQPIANFRRIIDQELAKANRIIGEGTKLKDYYHTVVKSGRNTL
tara:strand:- start:17513 stop:18403 length:891 start_codon:yes stop_codon:yes gene_type:complete